MCGPKLTLNEERTLHWAKVSDIKKTWRESGGWAAVAVKHSQPRPTTPCGVEVQIWQPTAKLADHGAHFPLAKAFLDGLVDADVLPDDGPAYVAWMRMWAPEVDRSLDKGFVRIQLTLL